MDVVVFGGSFDPVHQGHEAIIRVLSGMYKHVVVVPCKLSPFKGKSSSPMDRMQMLRLVIDKMHLSNIILSDIELEREGESYTSLTIKQLKATYAMDNITLCIGADAFNSIDRWHDYRYVLDNTKLVVFNRQGVAIRQDIAHTVIDVDICTVSASSLKVDIAFDKQISYIDNDVLAYIKLHKLYSEWESIVASYEAALLGESRIQHIYRATKCGIRIAINTMAAVDKVVTALLLHDISKATPLEHMRDILDKDTYSALQALHPNIRHSYMGERMAKIKYNVCDTDVLQAIQYHTTAKPNMSIVQKVVYLADALEEGRQGVDDMRAVAYSGDIDRAMAMVIGYTIDTLNQRDIAISEDTASAYEFYKTALVPRQQI